MKKFLSAAAVGVIALGLVGCSGDAAETQKADLTKPVASIDEAWEQLDELNYSFSKIANAEWMETTAPMLVQCSTDESKVQVFTTKKGVFSVEKYNYSEIADEISKSLEKSGLDVERSEDTLSAGEGQEVSTEVVNLYGSNSEDLNVTLLVDNTGYIDLSGYSKCVEGSVEESWSAPGRAPILKEEAPGELAVEDAPVEEVPVEEVPAEEEVVVVEE